MSLFSHFLSQFVILGLLLHKGHFHKAVKIQISHERQEQWGKENIVNIRQSQHLKILSSLKNVRHYDPQE